MQNAEGPGRATQSQPKACLPGPIGLEVACSCEFSAAGCGSAASGRSSGLKLGALPFQAQTSRMTQFSGLGGQADLGEVIDTSVRIVSTCSD